MDRGLLAVGLDRSLELVVMHEAGHQWWQSMVAFNEAEEPWLDEGFTDYSTVRLAGSVLGEDNSAFDAGNLEMSYLDLRRIDYLANPDVPMYGHAWDFGGLTDYSVAAYSKPALSLSTLERVLGKPVMLKILSTFFQRYRFAHPTTDDFRSVAEEMSGQNLSWFFDGLVYGKGVLNYTVTALQRGLCDRGSPGRSCHSHSGAGEVCRWEHAFRSLGWENDARDLHLCGPPGSGERRGRSGAENPGRSGLVG